MKKQVRLLWLLLVCTLLAGCGVSTWDIVKQAAVNPMKPTSRFKVESAVFDANFRVGTKTEAEWIADTKGGAKEGWSNEKIAMSERFATGFLRHKSGLVVADALGKDVYTVRAKYLQYEPGSSAASATEMDADIEIVDPSGAVVDAIRVHSTTGGKVAADRSRGAAEEIGSVAATYLQRRLNVR